MPGIIRYNGKDFTDAVKQILKSGESMVCTLARYHSNDFVTFPTSGLLVRKILARMRLRYILVLACVRIWIFFLIEIAESVVDLPMLALICTDWSPSANCSRHG